MRQGRLALVLAIGLLAVACSRGGTSAAAGAGARADSNRQRAAAEDGVGAEESADTAAGEAAAPRARPSAVQTRAPRGAGGSLPRGTLRAQMVPIMDMNGFGQPLPALFVLIPVGWRAQGGVQWGQQFLCTNGYNFNWVARSADGRQTVAVLPQERWEANNYGAGVSNPGCRLMPVSSLRQYFEQLVGREWPRSQMLDFQPRPDLAAKLAYLNQATPTAMGEMRTWVDSGQALFEFETEGTRMRGVLVASAVFSMSRARGAMQGQTMDALSGAINPGFVATAPAVEFDLQTMEAIRQSFVPNAAWQSAIGDHNNAIARGAAIEVAKRGKIIAEYNDYVSLIRQEVAGTRARSDERRQREFGEVIRGTHHYEDDTAPGGRAELSNLYDHAWRLNDGSYVLSNDASFDPWQALGVEGHRLERAQ